MAKNITLSVPDEVANEMTSMPEINWSAVAKASIIQYIENRKHPDISKLLEKLSKQKSEEYVSGRKRADEIADKFGYSRIDIILRKYYTKLETIQEMSMTGPSAPWESVPTPEEEMQKILLSTKTVDIEVSTEFLKGITDRLIEIDALLNKENEIMHG